MCKARELWHETQDVGGVSFNNSHEAEHEREVVTEYSNIRLPLARLSALPRHAILFYQVDDLLLE
jgi:hypothetical protein